MVESSSASCGSRSAPGAFQSFSPLGHRGECSGLDGGASDSARAQVRARGGGAGGTFSASSSGSRRSGVDLRSISAGSAGAAGVGRRLAGSARALGSARAGAGLALLAGHLGRVGAVAPLELEVLAMARRQSIFRATPYRSVAQSCSLRRVWRRKRRVGRASSRPRLGVLGHRRHPKLAVTYMSPLGWLVVRPAIPRRSRSRAERAVEVRAGRHDRHSSPPSVLASRSRASCGAAPGPPRQHAVPLLGRRGRDVLKLSLSCITGSWLPEARARSTSASFALEAAVLKRP